MCVGNAMQHYLYFFRIIYHRKRGCAVKAKRDTHSDNGQRSKTRGLYNPYPNLYSGAAVSVLIGTVHPVFVPADVRLFRAVHLCLSGTVHFCAYSAQVHFGDFFNG